MLIGFDETHAETWTISEDKAQELNGIQPEYHYLGHFTPLLSDFCGCSTARIIEPFSQATLAQFSVLVIAHPSDASLECGCGGSPQFSREDIECIVAFVANGGGVFVLGEWETSRWKSNINDLLVQFGLSLGDDTLKASRGGRNAHLLAQHFVCSDISRHDVTDNIKAITYHRGCSVNIAGTSVVPLIRAPHGQIVCAAAEYQAGRVICIGDSDPFAIPFVGHADNAQFFLNIVAWLARAPLSVLRSDTPAARLRQQTFLFDQRQSGSSSIASGHMIDCGQWPELAQLSRGSMPNPYDDESGFLLEAELKSHELPYALRKRLLQFHDNGNRSGVLLLKSLPRDPLLPVTPSDSGRSLAKSTFISEFWLAAIGTFLGDPFNYFQEKNGALFQTLSPTRANADKLSSESSTTLLDFHTETAFHPFMPDFLLLYCLRSDHDGAAKTFFASTRNIIPRLPLRYRAILFEEVFQTGIDYSFGSQSGMQGNGPLLPVLYGPPYDPFMKYDLDLMIGLDVDAKEALRLMRTAANDSKDWVKLEAGDLLIIDNRRCIHGRSEFVPRYDGMDRWLQRFYVIRDIAIAEEHRRGSTRILETEFST